MADCTITDKIGYWGASGTFVGSQGAQVYAIPDLSSRRYDDGTGTFRTLGINPSITVAAYQLGRIATCDATGTYTFNLPYGSTATHPSSPTPIWSLVFPNGLIVSGEVPADPGPFTVDDLVQSWDWTYSNEVYVAPIAPGQLATGQATFSAASSVTIVFADEFTDPPLISLTASVDSLTDEVVAVSYANVTTTGFDIIVPGVFSGTVCWQASL